jgi:hypothetical protein
VKRILDSPRRLKGFRQTLWCLVARGDVVSMLQAAGFVTHLAQRSYHEQAFKVMGVHQYGNGCDLVTLWPNLLLTKGNTKITREGDDGVCRSAHPFGRTANRFAVYHNLSGWRGGWHNLTHPAAKDGFELFGIECAKQAIEGRRLRRRSIFERQKANKPRHTCLRPKGGVLAGIPVAQVGADSNHLHFPKVIQPAVAACPSVFDLIEAVHHA